MRLNSGEFKTEAEVDGDFSISICQEKDYLLSGMTIYLTSTNTFFIEKRDAKALIEELQRYIDN